MSLSAALKAGLGVRDAGADSDGPDWDPYPTGGETAKPAKGKSAAGVLAAPRATTPSSPGRTPREPHLTSGLSDSLPTPKISAPPARQPANANTSTGRGKQPSAGLSDSAPTQAPKVGRVTPQQYVRELDRFHAEQNRRLTQEAVMDVTSHEVERVAKLAARVRGRYIAKLLDAGDSDQAGLKEAELVELRRYRESHEELCRGLDLLKSVIAEGDISVSGMIRR